MKKALILLFAVIISYSNANAQKAGVVLSDTKGWHKIGSATVDFQRDTDEIYVLGADRFADLKFKVENASINLIGLKVYFEDGTTEDVTSNFPFSVQAPGESKVINLKGGERDLKKVRFTYSTVNNMKDKKATVELWGLKTNVNKDTKEYK